MIEQTHPTRHRRGQPGPGPMEILHALQRLHTACALGHFNRDDGTVGRTEFENAMKEARHVLQRSRKYGEEA